jgi:hypothetical protein
MSSSLGRDTGRQGLGAQADPNPADVEGSDEVRRPHADRQEWFVQFANERVIPLLQLAAQDAEKRGCSATVRLFEAGGRLVAELQAIPPGLPPGAPPPRLTVTTARPPRLQNAPSTHDRPLLVEYTGTFPGVGATGGFGGEVDYDSIYPSRLEEKVIGFLDLATGG